MTPDNQAKLKEKMKEELFWAYMCVVLGDGNARPMASDSVIMVEGIIKVPVLLNLHE